MAGIYGALLVVGIDPDPRHCELALRLENPHLGGMEGYEVVIEASGVPGAAQQAYQRLSSRQEALVTIALDWTA